MCCSADQLPHEAQVLADKASEDLLVMNLSLRHTAIGALAGHHFCLSGRFALQPMLPCVQHAHFQT